MGTKKLNQIRQSYRVTRRITVKKATQHEQATEASLCPMTMGQTLAQSVWTFSSVENQSVKTQRCRFEYPCFKVSCVVITASPASTVQTIRVPDKKFKKTKQTQDCFIFRLQNRNVSEEVRLGRNDSSNMLMLCTCATCVWYLVWIRGNSP